MRSMINALFGNNGNPAPVASGPAAQRAYDPDRPITGPRRNANMTRPGEQDRIINRLPSAAAARLRDMLNAETQLGTYLQDLAFQQSNLATQKTEAQGLIDRLRATRAPQSSGGGRSSYMDQSLTHGAVPSGAIQHHVPQVASNDQLSEAQARVAEITRQQRALEERIAEASKRRSNLARNILQWLATIPASVTITSYDANDDATDEDDTSTEERKPLTRKEKSTINKANWKRRFSGPAIDAVKEGFVFTATDTPAVPPGQTDASVAAIDELRQQIVVLRSEINAVRAAPISSDEMKKLARQQIDELAAKGAPNFSPLVYGGTIQFPRVHVQGQILGGGLAEPAITSHNADQDPYAVMAFVMRDAFIARAEEVIAQIADDENALSPAQRVEREKELREDILLIERAEVRIINALAASGAMVQFREDSDPRAVLNLSSALPAAR